jgi:hypothetical protein
MLGIKSFFRRRKKKRKAEEEPKIEPEKEINTSNSKLPNDITNIEPSTPEADIATQTVPSIEKESTLPNVEPPTLSEANPETEPSTTNNQQSTPSSEPPSNQVEPVQQTESSQPAKDTIIAESGSFESPIQTNPQIPIIQTSEPKKTSKLSIKSPQIRSWINKRKEKSKEKIEQDRNKESSLLKYLTFIITAIAMALAMSFLPLFPQPLPLLLAILVAFVTFRSPRFGMPIGGGIIGLGLIFHLSELYFFSFLGEMRIRIAIVVIWMALFIILPIIFNRYKSALAIDFGLLAFTMLFSNSTYFLAIPLILVSAVFFKRHASLSMIYYVLLSVPLQIVQYFEYTVANIVRPDWWLEPGSSPPIFVSLSPIFTDLNSAMSQFRLYDTSKVIYDIAGQMTWEPNFLGRTLADALRQYLDSIPGILLFVVIVAGLAGVIIFFSKALTSKGGLISLGDKLFLCITATITCALFFIFLSILQLPLAFTADVAPSTFILAPLATLLLTLPVIFVDFTPKQTATTLEVKEKAQNLLDKLGVFNEQIGKVKESIPVNVSTPEGKMLVLRDLVKEIVEKCEKHFYEVNEVNEKFVELDKLDKDVDELELQLSKILIEYQILVSGEFSNWIGKFKECGLTLNTTTSASFQQEMTLDERIKIIESVLAQTKSVAKQIIAAVEPIYDTIRELFDPSLPENSKTIQFAKDRLENSGAPWIAVEALHNSIHNWNRQYSAEVSSSMNHLQKSLGPIVSLNDENHELSEVFGDNLPKILDYAKEAEAIKSSLEFKDERSLFILKVVSLKNNAQSILCMSQDILFLLYKKFISEEVAIEQSLPVKDYPWSKNTSLNIRLKKANEAFSAKKKMKFNQLIANLPTYLLCIDETFETLSIYKEEKDFILSQFDQPKKS